MISSIHIKGYRAFDNFEMSGLGRINLLVGTNNSGKTSVLESIYLLSSQGDPGALGQLLRRRGERLPATVVPGAEGAIRRSSVELDISHLFRGHELQPGATVRIASQNQQPARWIEFQMAELSPKDQPEFFPPSDDDIGPASRVALVVHGFPRPTPSIIPLTRNGGLQPDAIDTFQRRRQRLLTDQPPAYFITTESLTGDELVGMWNKISLTPTEGMVLRALQFLDSDIERIAAQATASPGYGTQIRGGFIIKRRGWEQPVPIGSMGDGMWRMLAMAIAISHCRGGVLLIDEIDTGLHYSVMSKMWHLIYNTARELDVQVFATTHSHDCVYSLAQVCMNGESDRGVTVQRIEPGRNRSVPYDQDEIKMAALRDIEVR